MLFDGDGTHFFFAKKTSRDHEKKNQLHFCKNFSSPISSKQIRTRTKKD